MTVPRFGRQQLRIMQVLWEKGRATAREITDAMNHTKPMAHSTVQTLLRTLEKKGAVAHEVDGRTFVFRPLVQPEEVRQKVTRECIDFAFDGSPGGLVSYLLQNERIPHEELERIRRQIDNPEKAPGE